MKKTTISILLFFTGMVWVSAQPVNISGKVIDQQFNPLSGVKITLVGKSLTTYSNNSGDFFISTVGIDDRNSNPEIFFDGQALIFNHHGEKTLISIYATNGRLVNRIPVKLSSGIYRFYPTAYLKEEVIGLYLISVQIENQRHSFKILNTGSCNSDKGIFREESIYGYEISRYHSRKSAQVDEFLSEIDKLLLEHSMYHSKEVFISSYTANVGTISLDKIEPVPEAPTNFVAQATGPNTIKLSWNDNSSNESGFRIETYITIVWAEIDGSPVSPNSTTFQISGLKASTQYSYRLCAYNDKGNSDYVYASATTLPEQRSITLINNSPTTVKLKDIVQVKVARYLNDVYMRNDLLTNDPARCLSLPGESIAPGKSQKFDITIGPDYSIFIGIGVWDLDNYFCSYLTPWFKCTYFVEAGTYKSWYVWTAINVTGHSGAWNWTVAGSYLSGTLAVTPAGNNPIYFNRTDYNPIK